MSIFSVDGGIYKFMRSLLDVLKINALWLLFSIPIVTSGAATIAAFDVTMKMVDNEESYVARQFMKAFKSNIKKGIPLGLLSIVCAYIVWLNFSLFNQIEGNPLLLLIVGMIAAAVFTLSFIYAFALQARYENTIVKTLQNSLNISMRYFVRTLFTIVLLVIEFFIIFWNSTTIFIGILIGPVCMIYTVSGCAKSIFKEIEKEPGAVSNPEKL